jgi:hypothetical protein
MANAVNNWFHSGVATNDNSWTAAATAMIENVTGEVANDGFPVTSSRAVITFCGPAWRTHSGHRCPTAASIEHEGQIGRLHSVQASPVGRSGCR